jgi:chemotaxis protein MotA
MLTPIAGLALLIAVMVVALAEREGVKLSYFDLHAATVVFGGVIGSLLLAIDRSSLWQMLVSLRELFPSSSFFTHQMRKTQVGLRGMSAAWREGRRAEVLKIADNGATEELRVAADALLRQLTGHNLTERFASLRTKYMNQLAPVIEGWEIVSKLAPSFGMVGTVTGMVQLFKNMGENSGNLGGAMAMALLATLYGISLGAAVGGPMAARVASQLNERLAHIDLLEKTVAALVEEQRKLSELGEVNA